VTMEGATNMAPMTTRGSAPSTPERRAGPVRVWDPFVRVFHWLLVAGLTVNYFELVRSGKLPHQIVGYTVLALIAARILWGFVGSRHARFADFVGRPSAIRRYLGEILGHRDRRYLGHNPAGGAMVLALLIVTTLVGATGWLSTTDWFFGIKWMKESHEILANLMLALAGVHILGVIHASWRHRENLVLSMVTGRKRDGP
jgi:cytochrome b